MGKGKLIITTAIDAAEKLLGSENIQTFLCGKYSDGTPRSLPDALSDELYSPKQKKNKALNEQKKKKNKKKKNKKKNKKKSDFYFEL